MKLRAKLISVLPVQSGEGKNGTWKKGTVIVETIEDRFPRKVCVTFWGDDKAKEEDLQIGNILDIDFDVESREFNGKWYTDVKAWRIAKAADMQNDGHGDSPFMHPQPPMQPAGFAAPPPNFDFGSAAPDDLPF